MATRGFPVPEEEMRALLAFLQELRPRQGPGNLYSDSILALEAKTSRLKWYYQYTPHDLWDWDVQQPPVLVDAEWQGRPRKLLLHANRNGFFYVLDRVDLSFALVD